MKIQFDVLAQKRNKRKHSRRLCHKWSLKMSLKQFSKIFVIRKIYYSYAV